MPRRRPSFEEDQIAEVICKYYEKLFTSSPNEGLQRVDEALQPFAIHPDKAPGPDGFSASFFQANWETVGPAVTREIMLFFSTGKLRPSQNVTHVRLIPKIVGAKKVADYRPIALCNVFFKIISKMLALRLKPVLHTIISENQSAFLPGRAIADNILITHEVLQFLKTSKAEKRCTMAVKTDMSKAYDRVEWRFIERVLQRLGFHAKWVQLIMQCVSTVSYSYLINESVHGEVTPKRGIRQGDPLSPYLFILCGQVLSGLCRNAEKDGTLQGIRVATKCPRVNHLLFADDTMFFCQTSPANCDKLKSILWMYEQASGQQINTTKSSITFSSKTPEHFGRRKKDLFTTIVDRIRQCAASWSTRHLSKAGKLTMLKAVLTAIPTYTMSCFELPLVAKEVQMLQPGHKEAGDIYVWQPLQSGVYSTKSGYYTAAKMKLFMWSIAQEALPLGELLQLSIRTRSLETHPNEKSSSHSYGYRLQKRSGSLQTSGLPTPNRYHNDDSPVGMLGPLVSSKQAHI